MKLQLDSYTNMLRNYTKKFIEFSHFKVIFLSSTIRTGHLCYDRKMSM